MAKPHLYILSAPYLMTEMFGLDAKRQPKHPHEHQLAFSHTVSKGNDTTVVKELRIQRNALILCKTFECSYQ